MTTMELEGKGIVTTEGTEVRTRNRYVHRTGRNWALYIDRRSGAGWNHGVLERYMTTDEVVREINYYGSSVLEMR